MTIDSLAIDVMIDGLFAQNCALDGDKVLVEMLAVTKWLEHQSPALTVTQVDHNNSN